MTARNIALAISSSCHIALLREEAVTVAERDRIEPCPHCGHPVLHDAVAYVLTGTQLRLFDAIDGAGNVGLNNQQCMQRLYAHRADGGPASTNIITVMVHIINRKLRPMGIRIRSRGGPGTVYKLTMDTHPQRAKEE